MTTKVNVFANLQTEFDDAYKSLKDIDDSIKKITGREPGTAVKEKSAVSNDRRNRSAHSPFGNAISSAISQNEMQTEEPQRKRRFFGSAFSRIHSGERDRTSNVDIDEQIPKPTLQSSVIATPREVKQRTQALEEQKSDKRGMARNKRMFGMILGTLQKFQSEESLRNDTQMKKRVEIEKKLDAAAEEERAALKKEKKELFLVRREKQAQIRRIEQKMSRVEIHQDWEKSHQHLGNFIQTKTKPHIFYLPAKHTPETEAKLQETKDKYRLIVAEKRAKVQKELSEIDELYKKNENMDDMNDENEFERSDEAKRSNESVVTIPMQTNDDRVVSLTGEGENITVNVNNTIEDTSNGTAMETDSIEQRDSKGGDAESFGDKEFEPIYDE